MLCAVIDRSYPPSEAAAAQAYVDTECKRGNVVLVMNHPCGEDSAEALAQSGRMR